MRVIMINSYAILKYFNVLRGLDGLMTYDNIPLHNHLS